MIFLFVLKQKTAYEMRISDWSSDVCSSDRAIAMIRRLHDKHVDFVVYLQQANNVADWEATKRSYDLYARYVMPHFSGDNRQRIESFEWCGENRGDLSEKRSKAASAMFDKHEAEQRPRTELGRASCRERAWQYV